MTLLSKLRAIDLPRLKTVTSFKQSWSDRRIQVTLRTYAFGLEQIDNRGVVVQMNPYKNIRSIGKIADCPGAFVVDVREHRRRGIWIWEYHIKASENLAISLASGYMGYIKGICIWEYHIKASENLAISLASGYMGIYHGHLDMGVPYQGIRESCDFSGIRIYGDISRASGYGSTISRHQRILRLLWHPDIWGYIKGIWIWEYHIKASENLAISLAFGYMGYIKGICIWEYHIKASENLAISLASGYMGYIKGICIWEYHIKASENLAISLASGYMGIYHGHLDMGVPYQGIRESCDFSGIRIYGDISRASVYGSTISRHQRILRFLWHPDIWGYIKGIWIWEYHIKASENLAITLASGYMGIYQGHLDMGVPYQGIRESCDFSGIRIYGDISWASGYGSTISRHQRILRFLWHPDIWGYIKGIWIWEYHIKASENLAISLASEYMGIYHGHLDMGVPYQGLRESCDFSGIRIYGDISWASGYGSTISRHQRILRLLWHPDIWGYIKGIWIWEYHIKASENLAISLASGYMGIYQGHLDMGVPYQGIRESCDFSGIRIYGDISWASGYGSTISRHQRILRFLWHPDIWGYIMGIWIWEYHVKASENLAISLASGYMGIYQGHLDMGVPYQGIRESCDFSGIRIYGDISWASGYGSTMSRHQRILRFLWHPDIWGYIMGIWIWEYHVKASENLAISLASGYMGIYQGHLDMGVPYQGIRESCDFSGIRIYGDISWASGYGSTISLASGNLAITLASGYMGIYHGHLDMGVPYQGIRESCDFSGIRIYGDLSWASGYGSTISRHQRILRLHWHPDIWGFIMGIWIWEYHIKASENLAISLASGYMGYIKGIWIWEYHITGIRESCDYSGIRIYGDISWASGYGSTISRHQRILRFLWHPIYGDISWASGYGSTISRHQRILRFFWHPNIWGYIMGIWIWEYHIKASKNLAISLASGYMGIYHGHLDMGVPYQGIRESCDFSGIRIYGDISRASGYGSTISRHQRILRFLWHPDIWGYIMGIWIWEYHIKASENLAISLASGYMGIYHGHLDMGVPYQGIRESCDFSGIRIYGDISWASGYGSTISRHQRILRLLWHPDIWGYIKGIWIWEYHIKASENLAISLASGYMGIYHGHLDMGVPYQGIRESCDYSGIRIYGDISWASGYGSTISRHQRILRFLWHPDIWGFIMGIWIWEYHIKASENLAITLASGYMGIYHGHLDMGVPYQGIRESCDFSGIRIYGIYKGHLDMGVPYQGIRESCDYSGIRIYGDISWASGYGSTISRHQRILRFLWHPDIWGLSWASGYGSTISRHQRILRLLWHPDIWGYIMGIWIWEYHIKASENLAISLASGYMGYIMGIWIWEYHIKASENLAISLASGYMGYIKGIWIWEYHIKASENLAISLASGYMGYIKGIWIWEYHIKASENLAISLASGYMGIYHGHLDMGVPYQGIRESCDFSGIRIYGDISWASGYGSTISRHQRILRFLWHPDIWGYIMGIWIWEYHIKASENLAISLASGYMGIYHGHLDMGVPYQGIRESCDFSGIRIYGDISWASGYGSTISRHQRILRFLWHPDIWGYIMGIWIWEYHIKASENLAISLASGYMGIYHGHLDMGVPYQGIRESCDFSGIRIYGDISWASGYGSTISRHQRILRFLWHPDIWGYIMGIWIWEYHIKASENLAISLASGYMGIYQGIWIWEYHIKASENLAISLASGYMGIYHGHLDMGVPYQGIRESCDYSGIRIYGDISWASGYGSTISRHQRILRLLWHPDIWGYIMGIWIWEYHIKASENLAILWHPDIWGYIMGIWIWEYHIKASENLAISLASGYMGIYHGHLDMGVPYQGIRESCDFSGIRIYGIYQGIWIWEYHIKASENLAITLASGYMGIYHGHLDMGVPYQGIRESCDFSGIRIYGDISWASGYGSTISRHQRILRFLWHPDIWDI
ncbi:hypothetical protein B9Z55_028149 [Caenorhabditis nigoni]|uniref:DnaJ homologue subfamily C GRV2/DNAJC13 N-terminal domain-containing protein n=1 Tax=Caenorhabditis nigoni TaxID=1611254 RepID=A0A2G5SCL5_9PELO|nr:hypothetical protein B9Z55_028149 [Caenorhabditis nigoni]